MCEAEYRILTSVGGGSWYPVDHCYRIAKYHIKKLSVKEFERLLKKLVAYGHIRAKKDGVKLVSYKNLVGITQRGSDALEYWKRIRYEHTDKKSFLSKEGQAMISLPK